MTLKLERDQARAVRDNFFPYLEMLCDTKYQELKHERDTFGSLNVLLVRSLLLEVVKMFDRKLLTDSNRFTFKFNQAQGITIDILLLQVPLNPKDVWLCNLRQLITDTLHQQIIDLV
jgi:hypothetical protein